LETTMAILSFDEPVLRGQLERLPREHRAAFAAACAERLFPGYVRFSHETGRDPKTLRAALDALWDDLTGRPLSEHELRATVEKCRALVPSEEEESADDQPYAEDAVVALVYALEARMKQSSQEAAWSARRAYEALDHFVMFDDSGVVVTANEQRLLEHPLVQAELARQKVDLDELFGAPEQGARDASARLRDRAKEDAAVFFGGAP
jgi:uncharacterized protein YjaG (DUF416 family)